MNGKEFESESVLSELKMNPIVFDELNFERTGFAPQNPKELEIGFGVEVEKHDPGHYRVILAVSVKREDEFNASVQVSGFCTIDEDNPMKEELLNKNAVAILFPYVRAQLTLLTAQPEMTPVTLPAVNINALIEKQNTANHPQ